MHNMDLVLKESAFCKLNVDTAVLFPFIFYLRYDNRTYFREMPDMGSATGLIIDINNSNHADVTYAAGRSD